MCFPFRPPLAAIRVFEWCCELASLGESRGASLSYCVRKAGHGSPLGHREFEMANLEDCKRNRGSLAKKSGTGDVAEVPRLPLVY